jgi:serine/threonine-protein kinase
MPPPPVQTEIGRYRLLRKLATGGMAEVYLAQAAGPAGFQKTLVLKRILPRLAEDSSFVEMFLNEARLAALLNHPNIVQIFDLGEADGSYYIAMEHIDGPNLRALCRRALEAGRIVPFEYAAKVISLACEGLGYAHDFADNGQPLNLIHRDISPDNILISRTGAVKLVDFGIAKAANRGCLTKAGTLKGKLSYMTPEQLRDKPLDRRADIFALGVVLYELIAGTKPFDASSEMATMHAILRDPPTPLKERRPECPAALVAIVDRALEKDRERRYPDCRAMQRDLEQYLISRHKSLGAYELAQLVIDVVPPLPGGAMTPVPTPRPAATPKPKPEPTPKPKPEPVATPAAKPDPGYDPDPGFGPEMRTQRLSGGQPAPVDLQRAPAGSARATPEPRPKQRPSFAPELVQTQRASIRPASMETTQRAEGGSAEVAPKDSAPEEPPPQYKPPPHHPTPRREFEAAPRRRSPLVTITVVVSIAGILAAGYYFYGPQLGLWAPGSDASAILPGPDASVTPPGPDAAARIAVEAPDASGEVAREPDAGPKPIKRAGPGPRPQLPTVNERPDASAAVDAPAPPTTRTPPTALPPSDPSKPAVLEVVADPPCVVTFDGRPVGKTPVEIKPIAPGQHQLTVNNAEKNLSRQVSVMVQPHEQHREFVRFVPGTLEFRVQPWALVEVDGKRYGKTPIPDGISVYEGEHHIRLFNPDLGKEYTRLVTVKAGQREVVKVNFADQR